MRDPLSSWGRIRGRIESYAFLGPLLVRLSVGAMFATTGWGKLQNLDRVIGYFSELGIPAPHLQAPFVATLEFVGGIALILGLATRVFGLGLAATMIVAVLTARLGDVDGVLSFLALEEVTYLAALVWLVCAGAGAASIDAILSKKFMKFSDSAGGEKPVGPGASRIVRTHS